MYFRSVAALEYAHGANILLFDYRGHGQSSLIPTTCGNAEVNDLLAAVHVAASQAETRRGQVFIHGFSMGAAVALLLPTCPAVAGIIADSSYARLDEMVRLIITRILDAETAGWHGPARAARTLMPWLTRLTFLGGQLLFHARHHRRLVARPDRAIDSRVLYALCHPLRLLWTRPASLHGPDPAVCRAGGAGWHERATWTYMKWVKIWKR